MQGIFRLVICVLSARICFGCIPTTKISFKTTADPELAEAGELPFVVALVDPEYPGKVLCTGTLISSTLVLTSGLCIKGHSEIKAFFGITEFPPVRSASYETRSFTEDNVITYNDFTGKNDLVLLWFADPVKISDVILPIGLASDDFIYGIIGSEAGTSIWTEVLPSTSILGYANGEIVDFEPPLDIPCIGFGDCDEPKYPDPDTGAPLYSIDQRGTLMLVGINQGVGSWERIYTGTFTASVANWLRSYIAANDREK